MELKSKLLNRLDWSSSADAYDFGRPFPKEMVTRLFNISWEDTPLGTAPSLVYEPGVGTGRIMLPLVELWPDARMYGVDKSEEMLSIFLARLKQRNTTTVELQCGDIVGHCFDISDIDLLIFSSVLHAIPQWKKAIDSSLRSLHGNSLVALVGEEADLYNLALARDPVELAGREVDPQLRFFWEQYQQVRENVGAPSPESSQVGVTWQANNQGVADYLLKLGYQELKTSRVEWELKWSLAEMLAVIERRSYSSIFTLTLQQHQAVINHLNNIYPSDIDGELKTQHIAMVRFFTRAD